MPLDLKTKNKENKEEEVEEIRELSLSYSREEHYDTYFHKWIAPEHDPYTVGKKFYLFSAIFLAVLIIYSLVTNNPIVAITFILIGIVGYIYLKKEPQILAFHITHKGISTGNELYEFDNIKSFWIFYDPPYEKMLSLRSKSAFTPYIHIPIGNENPVKIREILIDFIPEEKQEHTFIDAAESMLHR
ncbi:MAG: hypothetical protein WC906_01710 [Parcubacteria group bacterium]|jgi:hypothetical protein